MNNAAALQYIPLDQLSLSPHNARKTGGTNVTDLAASIRVEGLLQNLTVIEIADGFAVVAGGRRLRALQFLKQSGELPEDLAEVPCKVISNGQISGASAAENIIRERMHPADEFDAFRAMVDGGTPIADVAAHFGIGELVVKQRLKLAQVHPDLLEIYRSGGMSLEQLQAFTVTDDQVAQRNAWFTAESWARHANHLRSALTRDDIRATHPLVRVVGLETYKAAGGGIRQDLFASRDEVFLTDRPLLESLARAKLQDIEKAELEAGWSWVEVHAELAYGRERDYPVAAQPTGERYPPESEARLKEIDARLEAIDNTDLDELDDDEARKLEDERDSLEDESRVLEDSAEAQWPAGTKEKSGVLIYMRDGEIHITHALLKPGQKIDKTSGAVAGDAKPAAKAKAKAKPDHSDALLENLSAHRAAVACAHIARTPKIALAITVDFLWSTHRQAHDHAKLLALAGTNIRNRLQIAPGLDKSLPVALDPALHAKVPKTGRLAWLFKQPEAAQLQLLAFCVAKQVDGVRFPNHSGIDTLHELLKFDVAKHWKPTTDDYLGRVAAPLVVAAVRQACGHAAADKLKGLKKAALVAEAGKQLAGTGWLLPPLRGPGYALKKPSKAPAKKAKGPAAKKAPAKATKKVPAKAPTIPASQ